MKVYDEYKSKLRTADEAVKVIKSGDWVDYTVTNGFPALLDKALAKRKEELFDVKIRGNLLFGPIHAVECDPEREHFIYNSWHMSSYERKLSDKGLCSFIPMVFRNSMDYYKYFLDVNVAMMSVTPMDDHGYFNLSSSIGHAKEILNKADIVILEINEKLPWIYGGYDDCIHISEVDYIVEGENQALVNVEPGKPSEVDIKIADHILPHIVDGAILQLGIGGMPGVIGQRIADSDIKDLGMHTELCSDAYLDIFEAGKLTNKYNAISRGKGIAGIMFGTERFYEWVDRNPGLIAFPLKFVNAPDIMAQHDNLISINSCISVDLYGQVSSESSGTRQISGTGGQLDFLEGASLSKGGKSFLCLPSSHVDKNGKRHSNIKPTFQGDIITSPRSQAYYIVTEYGAVNLEGRTTWERAELLISIAHPDFREALIMAAEKQGLWLGYKGGKLNL